MGCFPTVQDAKIQPQAPPNVDAVVNVCPWHLGLQAGGLGIQGHSLSHRKSGASLSYIKPAQQTRKEVTLWPEMLRPHIATVTNQNGLWAYVGEWFRSLCISDAGYCGPRSGCSMDADMVMIIGASPVSVMCKDCFPSPLIG